MRLGDFIDRVCREFDGYVLEPNSGSLSGAPGHGVARLRRIVRVDDNGRRWLAPIPERMNADTEIYTDRIRSLCHQLGLDPASFGIIDDAN